MTWSYGMDPSGDPVDEVRVLVGDINTADQLVSNEVIEYALEVFPKVGDRPAWLAAAMTCDVIVSSLARNVDFNLQGLSKQNSQKYDHYLALGASLRQLDSTGGKKSKLVGPMLGGGGSTTLDSVVPE